MSRSGDADVVSALRSVCCDAPCVEEFSLPMLAAFLVCAACSVPVAVQFEEDRAAIVRELEST
ncbi:hypothetical protein [Amycolatopsis thermoflava]|uniref:hypothetical protein n=1 Tax=Amycolatopsis thermoflava TaxID=84480 RepID=UPI003F49B68B